MKGLAEQLDTQRFERRTAGAVESRYASYQLIRNVLAAHAQGCSFCVVHDQRRLDLREAWFQVMAAVKHAEMRVRLKVLTWQELAVLLPLPLQAFLDRKYGIALARKSGVSPGGAVITDYSFLWPNSADSRRLKRNVEAIRLRRTCMCIRSCRSV